MGIFVVCKICNELASIYWMEKDGKKNLVALCDKHRQEKEDKGFKITVRSPQRRS